MSRVRALVLVTLVSTVWWACTEGAPTGAGSAVSLGIVPQFQISPADFDGGPIDRVRLRAIDVATDEVVGSVDQAVSSTARQWILSLAIDLGDAASLQIVVEAELFSGATVAWSGRLGPITVPNPAPALALDVFPGPLDNQDVTGIDIVGAPAQMVIGQTTTLTADVTLQAGSAASPVVYWVSSDPTVATVTPQGQTATLTAVSVGTVDIGAIAGPVSDEVSLEVLAVPQLNEWQGTTSDWHTEANWSTGAVPLPAQNVRIPASAVDPVIASDVTVTDLLVEAGATLTLSDADLTVTGDLDATGGIDDTGRVYVTGAGANVRGTITTDGLEVSGTVTADGDLAVDVLDITGTGATFDVGGQQVDVTELATRSGGALRMVSTSDVLTAGNVLFDGGSTAGFLTAGTLHVAGSFTAIDNSSTSFAASGSHTVVFDGPGNQTIHFDQPGVGEQRFQNVTFDQPNLMTLTSDFVVGGLLNVVDGTVDAGSFSVFVEGGIVDPASGLDVLELWLIGDITSFPQTLSTDVLVAAAVVWPNNATIDGYLTINNLASLNLSTTTLTVNGEITSRGSLTVPSGALLAGSQTLFLASGSTLNVDGAITLVGTCTDNGAAIVGSGIHPCGGTPFTKTWLGGGTGGSPTDWDNPANWSPAGVPGVSDVVGIPVTGTTPVLSTDASVQSLVLTDGANVALSGLTLTVSGNLDAGSSGIANGSVIITGSGGDLAGSLPILELQGNRTLSGTLWTADDLTLADAELDTDGESINVGGNVLVTGPASRLIITASAVDVYVAGSVTFDGASHDGSLTDGYLDVYGNFVVTDRSATGFVSSGNHVVSFNGVLPQSVSFQVPGTTQQRFNDVWINNSSGVSFDTNAFTTGDMVVSGRIVVPVGTTLEVGGDLTLSAFSELDVEGTLTVLGMCNVDPGAVITGGGTQPCGSPASVTRTWVGGASPDPNDWDDPNNWSPAGVPGSTDGVLVPGATPVPILASSTSIGSIVVSGSNYVNLNGFTLSIAGDASVGNSGLYNGATHLTGAGTVLDGLFYDLQISADRALSGDLYVLGTLTVENVLDSNGHYLSVNGDLNVEGPNAVLRSTDVSSTVYVTGDATFNGADHAGALTAGYMYLEGDLHATNVSATSFVSSGSHVVWLTGVTPQTVTFEIPGPSQQRFNDVIVQNTAGVTFSTNVHVAGDMDMQYYLIVPLSTTTSVAGTLSLYGSSLFEVHGTVTGNCVDNGAIIIGNGFQPCGSRTTADRYWLGGAVTGPQAWSNPDNWNPVGIPQASEDVLILYRQSNYPILSGDVTVASLAMQSTSGLDLSGHTLTVSGDLKADGSIFGGPTMVTGTGTVLEGNVEDLVVAGPRTTSAYLYVTNNLTVQDRLTIGSNEIVVGGNISVETANGELVMDMFTGYLYVLGNATFDGASLDGDLTGGTIYLEGDLTVDETYATSAFRSTGTSVYFSGGSTQIVSFSNPGLDNTQQSFANVQAFNGGGSLVFETSAYISGSLQASSQTFAQGGTSVLEVGGGLTLSTVTFDGLPLRLVTDLDATNHSVSNVTFTGMVSTVTQLYIAMPSLDAGNNQVAFVIDSPVFNTTPTGGGYYVEATNSLGIGVPALDVQLTNPTPPNATEYKAGTNTQITWGP